MTKTLSFPNKSALHQFLLNEWKTAVSHGDFERAIALDNTHYNELVKKSEDVGYWDRWQSDTLPTRTKLCSRLDRLCPSTLPPDDGSGRFLIVHHNYSGLAHETQLARNMAYLRRHGVPVNVEVAYLFGPDDQRQRSAELYDIDPALVHYLGATSYREAAERLFLLSERRHARGLIYPSLFFMAYWMSLLVPHANQKFVQMKYYPLHAGRIRKWTGGYRVQGQHYRIRGCDFEQLPILDLQLNGGEDPAAVHGSEEAISIGSISRPEKIANAGYNRFVLELLAAHPSLQYLYTGREESLGVIPSQVREHPRSVALGWVDPAHAVGRFGIYLEPFPWGGGEMTLLALESGLPYLTLETEESVRFGIYGFIKCVAEGGDPLLQYSFCKSQVQLRKRVAELVVDGGLRQRLGAAWRQAIRAYRPPSLDSWRSLFND